MHIQCIFIAQMEGVEMCQYCAPALSAFLYLKSLPHSIVHKTYLHIDNKVI